MPHHRYYPRHEPPSFADRLKSHAFEMHIGLLWLFSGFFMILVALTDISVSRSMEEPAWWAALLLGLSLLVGAGGVWMGLLHDFADIAEDWLWERVGLLCGGLGLLGYGLAVLWSFPNSVLSWLTPVIFASAVGVRLWATFDEEDRRRTTWEEWKQQQEERGA